MYIFTKPILQSQYILVVVNISNFEAQSISVLGTRYILLTTIKGIIKMAIKTTPTGPMDIDEVLNIFRDGMPKLNGIQQEAIDRAIWYLEHHQMD